MNNKPAFWRDAAMPHVELREIEDGGSVSYAAHSHREWSIGAIVRGESSFQCGPNLHAIDGGTLVMMNPDQMHACNPANKSRWAYLMLYINSQWLASLRYQLGYQPTPAWQDINAEVLRHKATFAHYLHFAELFKDSSADLLEKQSELIEFFGQLFSQLETNALHATGAPDENTGDLHTVRLYMDDHCSENLSLDVLTAQANCSPGYFIKAFKTHSGFTPHAYLINRRIQLGQQLLKQGMPIAEAALEAGFSDQAHFQRIFKKLVAATPRQYQ